MLDTRDNRLRGGTGRVFDWSIAQQVSQIVPKLYLAGGLSPENVEEAINRVHPYAVDACSSLEDRPGTKNHGRMRAFVDTVRGVKTSTFPTLAEYSDIAPSPENLLVLLKQLCLNR